MITVYQLRRDKQRIEAVQKATLTSWKFGIMRTHGLFGSDEWWQKIESDKLLVHRLSGVITQLYMGGNHTLLDGHAAGLPATDLLLLTQLLTLDAAGDFLLRTVRISLPDFGQPLRDGEPVGADGPDRLGR